MSSKLKTLILGATLASFAAALTIAMPISIESGLGVKAAYAKGNAGGGNGGGGNGGGGNGSGGKGGGGNGSGGKGGK
jgi:hypothetical protein